MNTITFAEMQCSIAPPGSGSRAVAVVAARGVCSPRSVLESESLSDSVDIGEELLSILGLLVTTGADRHMRVCGSRQSGVSIKSRHKH